MKTRTFKSSSYDHRKISSRYINRYISLSCSAELQEEKMFPNVKEITESFGMLNACMMLEQWDSEITKDNTTVSVFVVGDGKKPRTAALIAFLTKWNCVSIDPIMEYTNTKIDRLTPFRTKIENITFKQTSETIRIVLLPHSHAEITTTFKKLNRDNLKCWFITMPCCVPHNLNIPCVEYRDPHVMSEKNFIKIYSNYLEPEFKIK